MKEKQVTEELGGILSYMTDVLFNEFNTNALTPEKDIYKLSRKKYIKTFS